MSDSLNLTLYIFILLSQFIHKTHQSSLKDSRYINKSLTLSYKIEEELPVQSLIANLITDLSKLQSTYPKLSRIKLSTGQFKLNLYEFNKDSQNLVRLNSQNGDLLVANRIDRETICPKAQKANLPNFDHEQSQGVLSTVSVHDACKLEYAVVLILTNGTEELWIPISITILDINDNRPVFVEQLQPSWKGSYEIEVAEDVPIGYKLMLLKAFDADMGDSSRIKYEVYWLNESSGIQQEYPFRLVIAMDVPQLILTNPLDYETKLKYMLELEACEPDEVTKDCTRIRIDILIRDVNDNAPTILFPPLTSTSSTTNAFYQTNMSENLPVNAVLLKVKGQDLDSGDFGRITYYLKSESSQFSTSNKSHWQSYLQIHPDNGDLRLIRNVQAHEVSHFRFIVCARDNGLSPLECCFTLVINVQDMNNHAPDIQLKKIGCGLGANRPNEIFIPSNIESGTHIGLIVVSDVDLGQNGKVTCQHAMNNKDFEESTGLSISLIETGKVSGRSLYVLQVERETLRMPPRLNLVKPDEEYPITSVLIMCNDFGQSMSLTSSVMLTIRMVHLHELDLCFEQKSYQLNVEESDKPMKNLIRPQLQDLALDIRFSIFEKAGQQNGCEQLEIDLRTGDISAPHGLDRERSAFIVCSIIATEIDQDKPSRTAVAEIVINLTDVNDNVPHLFKDILQNGLSLVEWDEMTSLQASPVLHPYIIGFLNAEDADFKENGSVKYYLKNVIPHYNDIQPNRANSSVRQGKDYQVTSRYELPSFQIDSETGLISLRRDHHVRVNREYISSFDLEVLLEDNGSVVKLSSVQTVRLHVLDVNDNEPMWTDLISFRTVKLDTAKEVTLYELDPLWVHVDRSTDLYMTQLKAYDLDTGENSRLRMSLIRPDEQVVLTKFGPDKLIIPAYAVNITTTTGELYLHTKHLNKESEYMVFVRVQDNGARRVLHCHGFFIVRLPLKTVTKTKMAKWRQNELGYDSKSGYLESSRNGFGQEDLRMLVIILFFVLAIILLFGAIILGVMHKLKTKRLKTKSKSPVKLTLEKSPLNDTQPTEMLLLGSPTPNTSLINTYPRFDTNPTWMSSPFQYVPTLSTENTMNSLYISQDLSHSMDYHSATMRMTSPASFEQPNYTRPNGLSYKADNLI